MPVELVTPPGRIVWGNPAKSQIKKEQKTKQPVLRDGKQVEQWTFGLAIPKADFLAHIWPLMDAEAKTVFPHGVPQNFSWKFKDGDGVDSNGKKFSDREGYAGHYVLTISTEAFAPPIYKNEGGRYRQLEPHEIKTGDYVVTKLTLKANMPTDRTHTPGLYVNPVGIELIGYGSEIISVNADPNEMFGGRTYALPPGASATPQAPSGGAAAPYMAPQTGVPGQPAPYQPGPSVMTAPYPPAPAPGGPSPVAYAPQPAPMPGYPAAPGTTPGFPPPAHDFVRNAGQVPIPGATAFPAYAPAPGTAGPPPAAPVAYAAAPSYPGQPAIMPGLPPGR